LLGLGLGVGDVGNAPPAAIRYLGVESMRERELIKLRAPKLGIAGTALLGDAQEAQRDGLPDGGSDTMPLDAVLVEVLIRDAQAGGLVAALIAQFDGDAVQYPTSREAEHPPSRTFQHFDQQRKKGAVDLGATAMPCDATVSRHLGAFDVCLLPCARSHVIKSDSSQYRRSRTRMAGFGNLRASSASQR
jgi:hypothetical protein